MAKAARGKPEAAQAEERRDVATTQQPTPSGVRALSAEDMADIAGVEGAGLSQNVDDRGTPLLYIAQKSSPQVNRKESSYIEGLEVGMAFNNLTGRFWDAENAGMPMLPCFFRANWVEWTPRDAGGGFQGMHPRDTPLQDKCRAVEGRRDQLDMPNGNRLVLTHHYFCIIAETLQPIIVPMSSTNLGASRRLQALIGEQRGSGPDGRLVQLPGYVNIYNFKTVWDSNDQGDWYKWAPTIMSENNDRQLMSLCREFALICKKGDVEIARPIDESGGASGDAMGSKDAPI